MFWLNGILIYLFIFLNYLGGFFTFIKEHIVKIRQESREREWEKTRHQALGPLCLALWHMVTLTTQ